MVKLFTVYCENRGNCNENLFLLFYASVIWRLFNKLQYILFTTLHYDIFSVTGVATLYLCAVRKHEH
jgi:hypothetical protein